MQYIESHATYDFVDPGFCLKFSSLNANRYLAQNRRTRSPVDHFQLGAVGPLHPTHAEAPRGPRVRAGFAPVEGPGVPGIWSNFALLQILIFLLCFPINVFHVYKQRDNIYILLNHMHSMIIFTRKNQNVLEKFTKSCKSWMISEEWYL